MIIVYGTLENEVHFDTSKTLQGAKNYATKNNYNVVTIRVGYNAYIVAEKINNKWIAKN